MSRSEIYTDNSVPKTLPLLLKKTAAEVGELRLQAFRPSRKAAFEFVSYKDFYAKVLKFAAILKTIGVSKGSNVAIISDNRQEWLVSDFAVLSLGAADVPRGCDSMGSEIRYIINFADCEIAFFENSHQLEKVLENTDEVPNLKKAILFEPADQKTCSLAQSKGIWVYSYSELMDMADAYTCGNPDIVKIIEDGMESIDENDNATIIFTSGTTGTPKGVMLTHKNFIAQVKVCKTVLPCKRGDYWLSVLPVWHSFERIVQYFIVYLQCSIAYSKPMASVMLPDMAEIKPEYMCGVPRLWESLASGVTRAMKKQGGLKYAMFRFFINAGGKYVWAKEHLTGKVCRLERRSRLLDAVAGFFPFVLLWGWAKLGDILVYGKIRAKLGGHMQMAISGGGALQKETDLFYRAVRVRILEGYGMTETAPVLSFRNWRHARPGCVGDIYPSAQIKIVQEKDGEIISGEPLGFGKLGLILAKGDQIMKGYYKRDDLTAKVIDKDGWLNTGDLGIMSFDKELKITGRAKDTIVLLDGENIEPLDIEGALCGSDYIESAVLFGQDKKYLGALIVPSKDNIESYAMENGIAEESYEQLVTTPEIQGLIRSEIENKINASNGFRVCEKIYKFRTITKSFVVGEELSAKQEIIRARILRKYEQEVNSLFAE